MRTAGEWADASTRRRFDTMCCECGLSDTVTCLGRLEGESLWNEYAGADLFFFPTFFEHETFGVVLFEAMAHGLPVVSTRWPGPVDVIEDGVDGVLCKPNDCCGFADAIQDFLQNPDQRRRMGERARLSYSTKYTRKHYAETLKRLFKLICGED